MDVYLDVMKPLVTVTEAISAQKWVTISTLRPLLHKLLKSHLIEKSSDTSLAKKMKSEMNNNLSSRYTVTSFTFQGSIPGSMFEEPSFSVTH